MLCKTAETVQSSHVYFSEYVIAIQILMKNSCNTITSLTSFAKKKQGGSDDKANV